MLGHNLCSLVPQVSVSIGQVVVASSLESKRVAVPRRDPALLVWPQGCHLAGDKVSKESPCHHAVGNPHHPQQCHRSHGDESSPAGSGTKGDTNSAPSSFGTRHAGTSHHLHRSNQVPLQLSGARAGVFSCGSRMSTPGTSSTLQPSGGAEAHSFSMALVSAD